MDPTIYRCLSWIESKKASSSTKRPKSANTIPAAPQAATAASTKLTENIKSAPNIKPQILSAISFKLMIIKFSKYFLYPITLVLIVN